MKLEELINRYYNQLHENDFHILKYILNNKSSCYKLNINDLAKKCNVSRSSVLRLAQKLDFSGYSEFRVFLKWEDEGEGEVAADYIGTLTSDIEATLKHLKAKSFEDICQLMDQSERIFVYGTGSGQLNAAHELQRAFIAQHRYITIIHDQTKFEVILPDLTAKDLMIIISLSGDTPNLIPKVQKLVTKGIPFLSITNMKNNSLAQMTPHNLYATTTSVPTSSGIDYTSLASFFIVGEVLVSKFIEYLERKKMQ
ncbi:MurR/RpiR family transcriptional regulator [Niallia sp. 03133]|uniref:MurR/RpiR family transcriptional regulator n=1 Tax=Niallia sp. 03133 TaxID=3458060 RepID=UPI004043A72D